MREPSAEQLHLVVDEHVPRNQKATTEEIIEAYRVTGTVWGAAKKLGMAGQTVHGRLKAIDYPMFSRRWTKDEVMELRKLVDNDVPLSEIARRLGRPYGGTAMKASELEIRSQRGKRERKPPRGAGYDKESVRRHLVALERYAGTVTQYARANGLHVDPMVKAIERNFPERWQQYVQAHATLPQKACEYCESDYYPNSGKQRFCTRQCQSDASRDKEYFGGNRRATIGLAAGVCQCCGGKPKKGISSHHMLGKENDPDGDRLIALCRGCHQLVTQLGARKFIDDPQAWEALILLAWTRRHSDELVKHVGEAFSPTVELGFVSVDEDEMQEILGADSWYVGPAA